MTVSIDALTQQLKQQNYASVLKTTFGGV